LSIAFAEYTILQGLTHYVRRKFGVEIIDWLHLHPPTKGKEMSITQTYFLAHSARGKLSREASRSDHDLRLLVGLANLLDSLMIELASAEQEHERWFNKSVPGAKSSEEEMPTHQWAETPVEEPEDDWEAEDAESTDDEEEQQEEEEETKVTSSTVITTSEIEEDVEDEEADDGELALTRTPSRHSPPELSADSYSDSEDEQMPPSPPQPTFDSFTEQQRQAIATISFYDKKDAALTATEQETFAQEGFYIPSRQQPLPWPHKCVHLYTVCRDHSWSVRVCIRFA
jgi:hypothetical protein